MVVAGAILFAVNGVVSKPILLAGVPAIQLTQLRSLGAFVAILGFLLLTARAKLQVSRRDLPLLAVYGIIGFAFVQAFYFVAIRELPVGVGLLLEFTAPIFIALWVRFGQHRPIRARFWAALALALFGLSLVAQVWQSGGGLNRLGVVAGFAAAISLAVYFLLGERLTVTERRDPVVLTCYGFGVASLVLAVVTPWWEFPWSVMGEVATLGGLDSVPVWTLAIWMVLLGTIAPFLLVVGSLRHLSATGASALGMLEPVLAFAAAWIVLGESLEPGQIAGAAIVIAGVYLAETSREVSRPG